MAKKNTININGVCYALIPDMEGGSECERCALQEKCHDENDCICQMLFGEDVTRSHRFELVKDCVTEEKAYGDYQERINTANDRGERLAWAFIIMLTGMLIANHGYLEYYVGAACGLAYLLLSMLQSAWQAIAIWIVKNRIKRDNLTIEDYPEWVGGWAWVFWYLKIGLLTIGTIYVAWRFISPLFDC